MTALQLLGLVWGALVAATIGSFMCVIIDRLPLPLDGPNQYGDLFETRAWSEVFGGTSRCSSCGEGIRVTDNIPLFGWLRLKGKCRGCGDAIPAFHPMVEVAVPVACGLMLWAIGLHPLLAPALFLVPVGIAISVIDLRTLIVPTKLVWPAFGIQVVISAIVAGVEHEPRWLLGGLVGVAVLAGPLFAFFWIHPRGMGMGDVRLATLLGWSVGFAAAAQGGSVASWIFLTVACMTISAVIGILFAVATSAGFGRQFPFGPSMVLGALISIALAERILGPFIN